MTMSGSLVQDLFQGNVFSNTPMTLEISTGNLDAGMYQVRLNSRDFVVTKKLLVTNQFGDITHQTQHDKKKAVPFGAAFLIRPSLLFTL